MRLEKIFKFTRVLTMDRTSSLALLTTTSLYTTSLTIISPSSLLLLPLYLSNCRCAVNTRLFLSLACLSPRSKYVHAPRHIYIYTKTCNCVLLGAIGLAFTCNVYVSFSLCMCICVCPCAI